MKAHTTLKNYLFNENEVEELEVDFAIQPTLQATCLKCARPLKAPKSVDRGLGPICWENQQLEKTPER